MAIPHAASGQLINVQPLAGKLSEARTVALFKSEELEVMRLIVPAGKATTLCAIGISTPRPAARCTTVRAQYTPSAT